MFKIDSNRSAFESNRRGSSEFPQSAWPAAVGVAKVVCTESEDAAWLCRIR
jgi:hypothetical protein